eukprot:gene21477-28451_t
MAGGTAFVYGSLMAPQVVELLLKRIPPMRPASLKGYTRYCVKNQKYPAIIPGSSSDTVRGEVGPESRLSSCDVYEDEEYYRCSGTPIFEDGSSITADMYVWKEEYMDQLMLDTPWDFNAFMSQDLEEYLEATKKFMADLGNPV